MPGRCHRGTQLLRSRQVQPGIHRVADPLHIAPLLNGKLFQGNHRDGIFQRPTRQGVASVQAHVALRRILVREVASSLQADVAALVAIQIDVGLHRRINPDGHQHIHPAHRQGRLTRHPSAQRVGEGGESHQVGQTILRLQGRVFPDVGHVRPAQQLQVASHHQGIHRSLRRGIEVGEQLAIDQALLALLAVEELQVIRCQFQVGHHLRRVIEIDIAIDQEGILVIGINRERI